MKVNLLALPIVVLMTACSGGDSGGGSGATGGSPSGDGTKKPTVTINEQELRSKTYSLKADLNFADADVDRYKAFEGTSMEYEAVSYFFAFDHQRRLNKEQIQSATSFCSVYVETSSPVSPNDIVFEARSRLLKGELITSSYNGDATFALQLQGEVFKSFFLKCKNVGDSAGALQHIGQILDIR